MVGGVRVGRRQRNDLKREWLADRTLQVILETRLTASRRSFVSARLSTRSLHAAH
jgi:hypothetical protein